MGEKLDTSKSNRKKSAELFFYIFTVLAIAMIWCIVLEVWRADWQIPFDYGTELGNDALGASTWIKSYKNNGFSWEQSDFSVPFFADRRAEFGVDRCVLLLEMLCARVFSSYGACLNALYLLSFLVTGVAAAYSLRCLRFSRGISLAGAVLYTFLQYHMMRGEMHLYLSFYYSVPLAVLVMLWLTDESLLTERFSQCIVGRIKRGHILFVLFSWIIGLQQPYYAFFAAVGIAFSVLCSACRKRFAKAGEGMAYLMIIAVTTLAENIDALLHVSDVAMEYMRQHRTVGSIEAYGLKIINLLLPVQNHRLPILERLRRYYDGLVGAVNREESWVSLGLILAACFCIAVAAVLMDEKNTKKMRIYGRFILAFILVSTVGGGSSAIGLIFSLLRCYNRMAVYIAMFCTIVFAALAERMGDFLSAKKIPRGFQCGILMLLTVFGVWDQTTPANVYAYEDTKEEYMRDEEFIQAIEAMMPEGAYIFELPLLPTGTTSVRNLREYELYKPYLHAGSTKWLHMYSVGSRTDQWVNFLRSLPLRTVIDVIVCCGFQGIYIDSKGYAPEEWEAILYVMDSMESTAIRSEDGQKVFYSLTGYADALNGVLGSGKIERYADFWLGSPDITGFPSSDLFYTGETALRGDGVIISPGGVQYGPYVTIQPGDYMAYVLGENLKDMDYDLAYANGTKKIPMRFIDKENDLIKYAFHVETETSGFELRCINRTDETTVIKGILLINMDQPDEIELADDFLRIREKLKYDN